MTELVDCAGPLHDPVIWYKITHAGEQAAQWDLQNKGSCFVLEVPLRNLLTSMCDFVPCDRIVQRAYLYIKHYTCRILRIISERKLVAKF